MKINKEIRQLSRSLMRGSYVDGALDEAKVATIVRSVIDKKPRNYIQLLESYQRLLRLEVEKRQTTIESAAQLEPQTDHEIVESLKQKYGPGLTTQYIVNPALLGGMRVRVGSDVWDSSVRNRLERLQRKL